MFEAKQMATQRPFAAEFRRGPDREHVQFARDEPPTSELRLLQTRSLEIRSRLASNKKDLTDRRCRGRGPGNQHEKPNQDLPNSSR